MSFFPTMVGRLTGNMWQVEHQHDVIQVPFVLDVDIVVQIQLVMDAYSIGVRHPPLWVFNDARYPEREPYSIGWSHSLYTFADHAEIRLVHESASDNYACYPVIEGVLNHYDGQTSGVYHPRHDHNRTAALLSETNDKYFFWRAEAPLGYRFSLQPKNDVQHCDWWRCTSHTSNTPI